MPKNQKQSKKSSSKIVIIVLVFLLAMGAILGMFLLFVQGKPDTVGGESASVEDDYPLKDDRVDPKKQQGGSDIPETPIAQPGEKAKVNVMLTSFLYEDGGWVVSGMVTNSTDTSGVCTYAVINPSGVRIEVRAAALAASTSVVCETSKLDASDEKGLWTFVLEYESDTVIGSNEAEFRR